jgi:tRNA pseudouridine55 synthase
MLDKKSGFILVDKPSDVTSFYCVNNLRRLTGVRRIGFLGTLDPLATGLMIFAVGEATKMLTYLEKTDKVYEVTVRLGATSNTYDRAGTITENEVHHQPTRSQIQDLLEKEFSGEIDQVPPAFSAIWVDGKRAYDLARKGKDVVLKSRKVHFHDLVLKSYHWPFLKLAAHCSSGTYIRSLAHDVGQRLGVGGLVEQLRRIKIGHYKVADAMPLADLTRENLYKYFTPVEDVFSDWQKMELNDEQFKILTTGGFIPNLPQFPRGPILAFYGGVVCAVLETWMEDRLKIEKRLNVI